MMLAAVPSPGLVDGVLAGDVLACLLEPLGLEHFHVASLICTAWRDAVKAKREEWSALAYVSYFGESGSSVCQFVGPTHVCLLEDGTLCVTDAGNARVQRFNPNGEYKGETMVSGRGNGFLPSGIASDSKGGLWVADANANAPRMVKLKQKNFTLMMSGADNKLSVPSALLFSPESDRLYCCDVGRVMCFDSGLQRLPPIGASPQRLPGSDAPVVMFNPCALAISAQGRLYVADAMIQCILIYCVQTHVLLGRIGREGPAPGQFKGLRAIAVIGNRLLTVEPTRVQLLVLDTSGSSAQPCRSCAHPALATCAASVWMLSGAST